MLGADLLIIGDGGAQTVGEGRVEQAVLRLYGGQVYRARHAAHYGLHRLLEIIHAHNAQKISTTTPPLW